METEVLNCDTKGYWSTILVNETYVIECSFTIWLSTRVSLRKLNDYGLMCNWCAGPDMIHVLLLVNTLLGYIEKKDEALIPFASEEKPYFNDSDFLAKISPYLNADFLYTTTESILPGPSSKSINHYEKSAKTHW